MMRLLLPAILLALACPAGAGGTSEDAVRATGFVPSVDGTHKFFRVSAKPKELR